jgi:starch phosphorylase
MEFTARRSMELPEALRAIEALAFNLHWVWNHGTDFVWNTLDADTWSKTHNPIEVLCNTPRSRLEKLAFDGEFLWRLQYLVRQEQVYLTRPSWYQQTHGSEAPPLTAYFSMEYGITDALPLYSGGLGVLAGDYLKTASDLGVPLVAIGIFYREGYFRQMLDEDGRQLEINAVNSPASLPIDLVTDEDGIPLRVSIELPGRDLKLRIWRADVGRVPLFLLDSDDALNTPFDRGTTAKLYSGGPETRLVQEIVLGVGGWRALEALGYKIDVCHLNEGHAAFATLERARRYAEVNACDFPTALWATRAGNVFTTHTPVAAAFDVFPPALMRKYGGEYSLRCGLDPVHMMAMGTAYSTDPAASFNMAYLAMHCCARTNAVSQLHARASCRIFAPLFSRWPEPEVPISHVTNAVHVPSWDSPWADELWTEACGKERWLGAHEKLPGALAKVKDLHLWNFRATERRDLIEYTRRRLERQLSQRGESDETVARAVGVLDPNTLTIGFARRFTEYKRPGILLAQPERLVRLLSDPARPVQLIIAGKAHPNDMVGRELVQQWARFVARPEVRARAVFIEDYDMTLAEHLVQGADLWINTPRRPWEASGTSGMKVLVNGGLNLSALDGWWAEAYTADVGWALGDGNEHGPEWDARDAAQLYELLEHQIVPLFYERDADGVPRAWVARIRASLSRLTPQFSSNRMVVEYLDHLYLPAARQFRKRHANGAQLATELRRWEGDLRRHWPGIRWCGALDVTTADGEHSFAVKVHLGEIPPDAIAVQLYLQASGSAGERMFPLRRDASVSGSAGDHHYVGKVPADRPASDYTARVVPAHAEAMVPAEARLIRWFAD